MAKVSITEAARLAGVSRGNMYKTYLNKGVLSTSKDSTGRKYIETSELLRVFGSLNGEQVTSTSEQPKVNKSEQVDTPESVPLSPSDSTKDLEIRLLREQLEKAEQREQWLQSQVSNLSDTLKLLEHKPVVTKDNRRWWQFMWK